MWVARKFASVTFKILCTSIKQLFSGEKTQPKMSTMDSFTTIDTKKLFARAWENVKEMKLPFCCASRNKFPSHSSPRCSTPKHLTEYFSVNSLLGYEALFAANETNWFQQSKQFSLANIWTCNQSFRRERPPFPSAAFVERIDFAWKRGEYETATLRQPSHAHLLLEERCHVKALIEFVEKR